MQRRSNFYKKQMIFYVWKYFAVVTNIFSLNIPFLMSIKCSGFPTNLIHFCNVISKPNKIQFRTFCAKVLDLPTHGGQPLAGSQRPTVDSTRPTVGLSGLAFLIQLDPIRSYTVTLLQSTFSKILSHLEKSLRL